ncbi:MAG: phosphotransferase [Lachnospiraceae bacterium]|nr:phosphotransferase [Lachnospiraceae bacterium]
MEKEKFVTLHTEQMLNYRSATSEELGNLQVKAQKQSEEANSLYQLSKEQYYYSFIAEIVEKHYDIGTLSEVWQIFGGYINTTFGIYTIKDGERQTWLFRMYKRGKNLDSLLFEHRLLLHARKNGFSFGAAPILNHEGKTYCQKEILLADEKEEFLFAVFNYVDGDVLYDWIPNWAEEGLNDTTIASAARCMAEFHSSTNDFDPQGLHGDNIMDSEDSPCNELIHKFPRTLLEYRKIYEKAGLNNVFTEYFDAVWPIFDKMCAKSYIPPEDYSQMQINPCHCDFHAGNFKYLPDGTICGSFDYDMAKFDSRLFEIGLAMHYVFASWKLATKGAIRLDRVERFIRLYDEEIQKIGKIPPLSALEKSYLYEVLVQGTAYVYGWTTSAVMYDPTLNPHEYLYYSQHYVACMNWLEEHETEIRELSAKL